MSETMAEMQAELARLAALQQKLMAHPDLDDCERETLEELLEEQKRRYQESWLNTRLQEAVGILFPGYDRRRDAKEHPVRWPCAKSWWWNGARILRRTEMSSGDVKVDLRSYVGRGETDDLDDFIIKKEWIEADDQEAIIRAACEAETRRVEIETRAKELAKAQREAEEAQARLRALQAGHG